MIRFRKITIRRKKPETLAEKLEHFLKIWNETAKKIDKNHTK